MSWKICRALLKQFDRQERKVFLIFHKEQAGVAAQWQIVILTSQLSSQGIKPLPYQDWHLKKLITIAVTMGTLLSPSFELKKKNQISEGFVLSSITKGAAQKKKKKWQLVNYEPCIWCRPVSHTVPPSRRKTSNNNSGIRKQTREMEIQTAIPVVLFCTGPLKICFIPNTGKR